MILAGDIGGTHTRLAFFDQGKKVVEQIFPSHNYPGLEEILREFLREHKQPIEAACFGVAGFVKEGICRATNLPWVVDAGSIRKAFHLPSVSLLNDLEAHAYGLKGLKQEELLCLHPGKPQVGNQALIAAGTGLGEAGLYWDGKVHHPFACEGGHADFAPRSEIEVELLQNLQKQFGHVSYERVLSGSGLHSLHQFLIETGRGVASPQIAHAMQKKDPSEVISKWGSQKKDPTCGKALDWFCSLYGAEAGNLALKMLAVGGVFIGGGIASHLSSALQQSPFVASFVDKGRFRGLLESIPLWVILNDHTALLGAAHFAAGRGWK